MEMSVEDRKNSGLAILAEIDRVCKLLNIDFYLAYGSLLGAVRHKGFIPWDDDIDIWMFRKDYEIFLSKFNELSSSRFTVYTSDLIPDYPYMMPKIVDNSTHVREIYFKETPYLGVWIDLFPIDFVTEESKSKAQYMVKLEHKRWCALYKQSTIVGKLKLLGYNMIQRDTNFSDFSVNPAEYVKEIHNLHRGVDFNETVWAIAAERDYDIFFDYKDFSEKIYLQFENLILPAPIGYDNLLKIIYGDYMKLPPKSKQKFSKHLVYAKYKEL